MPFGRHANRARRKFEYDRPWLYDKQREMLFDARDAYGNLASFVFIEASTKAGKTTGCIIWLVEQALVGPMCGPGRNFWWVAPIRAQAKIAFGRFKLWTRDLSWAYTINESDLVVTFITGSRIFFKSADNPNSLYGDDVVAAVVDEATRTAVDAWIAIRTTLTATRGLLRVIGNVRGRKNWAFQLGRRALVGLKGVAYRKLIAADAVEAGIMSAEAVEEARRDLTDNAFRELYLAEPTDDGGNPFSAAAIERIVRPSPSGKRPMAFGIDLGKSVDWTVIVGLDDEGAVAKFDRFQLPWPETLTRIRETVGRAPTLVDSTGLGDPIVEQLQRPEGMGVRHTNFEGFVFSSTSKQKIMEGLAVRVQRGTTTILDGPHKVEMESFEYQYTKSGVRYSAPEGMHDDVVCAHALAVERLSQRPTAAATFGRIGAAARAGTLPH